MKESKKALGLLYEIMGLAIPLIVIVTISVFMGAGLLNLLGFEYTSMSSVIFFFILYTALAFLVEPFVEAYVLAVTELGRLNKILSEVIGFVFCVGFDIVVISILENLIEGIMISNRTIILFSMITYIGGKILEEVMYNTSSSEGKKVKKASCKKKRKSEEE